MQMIARIQTDDREAWRRQFDARAEDRAGMTVMQIWHDADAAGGVAVLFDVHDRARAEAWVRDQASLGARIEAQYLRTA